MLPSSRQSTVILCCLLLALATAGAQTPDLRQQTAFTIYIPPDTCSRHPFTGDVDTRYFATWTSSVVPSSCNLDGRDLSMTTYGFGSSTSCEQVDNSTAASTPGSGWQTYRSKEEFELGGTECYAPTRHIYATSKCDVGMTITFIIQRSEGNLCDRIKYVKKVLTAAAVVGIVFAVLVVVGCIGGCIACCFCCRKRQYPLTQYMGPQGTYVNQQPAPVYTPGPTYGPPPGYPATGPIKYPAGPAPAGSGNPAYV